MDKPLLSKQAFWDVDMDKIDNEKNALYVLENVLINGDWEDFIALRNFYGGKKIRNIIVNTQKLGPKEISFCCVAFNLVSKDFKYPTNKPAYPKPWDYSGA